jgi:hypothetical protein
MPGFMGGLIRGARLPGVRQMDECAAAEEVGAERFIVVFVEQVRHVSARGDVLSESIAAVEIEDAIAGDRADIYPRQPLERIHPAVP